MATIAEEQIDLTIAISVYISVLSLFAYDYLLSLSREVELMWQGPFQFATVLYFTTRYPPFFAVVYHLATVHVATDLDFQLGKSEVIGLHFIDILSMVARAAITAALIAQAYAVHNQNRVILGALGALGLAIVVMEGFTLAADTCALNPPDHRDLISLVILTAFPTAVLCLTLYRVFQILRQSRNSQQTVKGSSLTQLILFESVCMSGVCILRLFNVLFFTYAPTAFNLGANPFILPVSALFISHFLLNLREVNLDRQGATAITAFTSVQMHRDTERGRRPSFLSPVDSEHAPSQASKWTVEGSFGRFSDDVGLVMYSSRQACNIVPTQAGSDDEPVEEFAMQRLDVERGAWGVDMDTYGTWSDSEEHHVEQRTT